ncbi:hypothetical protein KKG48_04505 [Patescibacteria group bacterium]|nr:hypothetical protein [Patescibacteria group bacterium]
MKPFKKQSIFILAGIILLTAGTLITIAYNNRGADPVLWLKMDEGVGSSTYDSSGSGNTASITNAIWKQEDECKFGKCLYFDGNNDNVSIPDFTIGQ